MEKKHMNEQANLLGFSNESSNFEEGSYEDKYMKFKERFIIKDLFDINSTQDIQRKLLEPILKQFRNI